MPHWVATILVLVGLAFAAFLAWLGWLFFKVWLSPPDYGDSADGE